MFFSGSIDHSLSFEIGLPTWLYETKKHATRPFSLSDTISIDRLQYFIKK